MNKNIVINCNINAPYKHNAVGNQLHLYTQQQNSINENIKPIVARIGAHIAMSINYLKNKEKT
ncbi:MAG: hypothetical protein ACI8RD_010076 [Bacillariaceae sp.]|jgi:hypothetical protein